MLYFFTEKKHGISYKGTGGINESIFPKEITNGMRGTNYKMIYYNLWDSMLRKKICIESGNWEVDPYGFVAL